jgi:DNA replication protein DnaC
MAKTLSEIEGAKPLGQKECVCEKHGPFISRGSVFCEAEIWNGCPLCAEEKAVEIQTAEAERVIQFEARFFDFIPSRYRLESFETYECKTDKQRRAVKFLREYRGDKNIIIHGNPGTGKTHLMWSLVKANPDARYWKLSDIIRRVKCSFAPTAKESEEDILNELAGVKILIIDEIGRQAGSNFETNLIFDLIDMRYGNYQPTVLCSNLPLVGEESIAGYIGTSAMDRINENAVEIYCDWENYRKAERRT